VPIQCCASQKQPADPLAELTGSKRWKSKPEGHSKHKNADQNRAN